MQIENALLAQSEGVNAKYTAKFRWGWASCEAETKVGSGGRGSIYGAARRKEQGVLGEHQAGEAVERGNRAYE